jgi:hypothetical protein
LPFEVFAAVRCTPAISHRGHPLVGLAIRSEVPSLPVSPYHCFGDPALPVGRQTRLCGLPDRVPRSERVDSIDFAPLFRFCRPPGYCPDDASRCFSAAAPSLGLRPLWHMRSREIRPFAGFAFPPPSVLRVSCHPLDGFRPLAPCRPCCMPTAPMGFSLRSVSPRRGWRVFPPAFAPRVVYHRPRFDKPEVRRSSGLSPDFRVLPRAKLPQHLRV